MQKKILLLTAYLAIVSASRILENNSSTTRKIISVQKEKLDIQTKSLSAKGKDALENFINKLPCGWPEAGIPPLAPFTKNKILFEIKKYFAKIFAQVEHFRIDGLDVLLVDELKINYAFSKKVKFNLLLPKVVISGKLMAGAMIDLMNKYGIKVQYHRNGDFELVLENIKFIGQFKYKMPYIFGSIEIYKFDGIITLGDVVSRFYGIFGEGKLKKTLENQIENIIMKAVNSNQDNIRAMLVEDLCPYLNRKLKGHKIWSLIRSLFGKQGKICYPPADPWMST